MIVSHFTFHFNNRTIIRFNMTAMDEVYRSYYRSYYEFEDKIVDMEEFGVHDCYVQLGDLEGFSSHEIKYADRMLCVGKWHHWFAKRGFTCGEIYTVPVNYYGVEIDVTPDESVRRIIQRGHIDEMGSNVIKTADFQMQINVPHSVYGKCDYSIPDLLGAWLKKFGIKNSSYCGSTKSGDGYTNGITNTESTYMVYFIQETDALAFRLMFPLCRTYLSNMYA